MSRLAMRLSPQSGSTSGESGLHRLVRVGDDGQLLVVDVDQVERRVGGEPVLGDDRGDRLADVAGAVDAEGVPACTPFAPIAAVSNVSGIGFSASRTPRAR